MKLKNLSDDIEISKALIRLKNAPLCRASCYLQLYLKTFKTYFPEQKKYWNDKFPLLVSEESIRELLIDFQSWQLDKGYLNNEKVKNGMVTEYLKERE